jgi:transglutaminase-like putative cysteine protease
MICFWLFLISSAVAQEIPEGGAAYDYLRWHYRVSGDKFTKTGSGRITIYNERGQEYAELAFYEDSFASLKSVAIKVTDASGSVLYERDKGDLTKSCGFGRYAIYDDQCNFSGTFQAQQFPYTVEYQYVLEHKTQFFLRGARFQRKIPVHHASFTLETKNIYDFSYRGYGLAQDLTPQKSDDGRSYTWELDSLPGLESIEFLPPGSQAVARLSLTPNRFRFSKYDFEATDWLSLGRSLTQMYRDRYLKDANDQPTTAVGSEEATAKRIYESVIQDIRYVAIEAGVGGWRPYRASLTLERGFGDCKDMSTLLVSKLRLAGIKADPVFVLTKSKGPIDPAFPGFGFNHVITVAVVNGDTVWMDPTCNNCPYGELPSSDEDIDVLVGADGGGLSNELRPAVLRITIRDERR